MPVPKRTKPSREPLGPGDTIGHSLSMFVRQGGIEAWVKYEATTTVQEVESEEDALGRVTRFVEEAVIERVTDLTEA